MSTSRLIEFLFVIPCVLIALSVHEVSHGWMAYKLGDPTAKNMGRLTLNPLKHLDPIGTLCMIFFHFGWARPVPINTRYFKNNKRDTALTAAAGPISNFIMAFAGVKFCSKCMDNNGMLCKHMEIYEEKIFFLEKDVSIN